MSNSESRQNTVGAQAQEGEFVYSEDCRTAQERLDDAASIARQSLGSVHNLATTRNPSEAMMIVYAHIVGMARAYVDSLMQQMERIDTQYFHRIAEEVKDIFEGVLAIITGGDNKLDSATTEQIEETREYLKVVFDS